MDAPQGWWFMVLAGFSRSHFMFNANVLTIVVG